MPPPPPNSPVSRPLPPPFRAHLKGTPNGLTGRLGAGPEVPQHMWLKMHPHNALMIFKFTSQRLLDQSQAGVYMGKTPHTPPFGPIRVPYPKGLNC